MIKEIISRIFFEIYCAPIYLVFLVSMAFLALVTVFMYLLIKNNKWVIIRVLGVIFSIVSICAILYVGVYKRGSGEYVLLLNPLSAIDLIRENPEKWREMFMNGIMFLPLGVFLPYAIPIRKVLPNIILSVFLMLILSVGIEFYQYYFECGNVETTDVICNIIGALFGSISFMFSVGFGYKKSKKRKYTVSKQLKFNR